MKIACSISIVLALGAAAMVASAEVADGVKAIVSDTVITYAQVEDFAQPVIEGLRRQYAGQPAAYQKAVASAIDDSLNQLVDRQLILHSFEKEGYKIPDNVIEDAFQERVRERFGDRVTMVKTLQAEGLTVEEYRKQMRDQYIEAAMRNQNVAREIIISPYKVENYYQAHQDDFKLDNQVKLRMITLNKNNANGTDATRLAGEIRSEIKAGATFGEMAMVYSQDAQQRQGGDRGWVDRSVLRKELADAAFALQPGETSEVIDLPEACYLVHVDQTSTAHVKALADVRTNIEKILRTEEQKRLEKQWMDGLRSKTFVQYF